MFISLTKLCGGKVETKLVFPEQNPNAKVQKNAYVLITIMTWTHNLQIFEEIPFVNMQIFREIPYF